MAGVEHAGVISRVDVVGGLLAATTKGKSLLSIEHP